jgi:4-hydroxyphenylpyruvate dioxygenase
MGPFPHDAPKAEISAENPAGTDGFEFVEFAHPEPARLDELFRRMGFAPVATHRTKAITLYRQGDVNYLLNAEPTSHAATFIEAHGPCAPAMAWRVVDADHALRRAVDLGATEYTGAGKALDVPAVVGIGGSLLYFVDTYGEKGSCYAAEFDWLDEPDPKPFGVGFYYLDHLTHNVIRGNMDTWYRFYAETFNFREIRFFDIQGKMTGLTSRALTSPDGKIRIPINESTDDRSQIEEYLRRYKGEGIQHIAVGTEDIYAATDAIAANGLKFMPAPPDVYYEQSRDRVKGHDEPVTRMRQHGILIDGEGVVGGGETRVLLQIFSKTVIGPIFFEFIQRKGDDGFGEGNFRALFESIEEDQIRRGVLTPSDAA